MCEPAVFGLMKTPLLLIRDRFQREEQHGRGRGGDVPRAEGRGGIHAGQRRQADGKHQRVLVDTDKKQVEQRPCKAAPEQLVPPHDGPAVILFSGPEAQAVRALAGKVDRQADAPRRHQQRRQHQPRRQPAPHRDDPAVGDRQQAP